MVINCIHFKVPPCCQGGFVRGRTKPKVLDEKYESRTRVPGAGAWQGGVDVGAGPGSRGKDGCEDATWHILKEQEGLN